MGKDAAKQNKEIQLDKKLITSVDSMEIGENFSELINLRYTDTGLEPVQGMTAINTTALSKATVKSAFHFKKTIYGTNESHVLAQASSGSAADIVQNATAIPSAGDFAATAVYSGVSYTSNGRFSNAPGGAVAYADGTNTLIWGGDQTPVAALVNYDPTLTFKYDYSEIITNSQSDIENTAPLYMYTDQINSDDKLLLHLDDNLTDASTSSTKTVTGNDVTYSTTEKKFGTHSAIFNGTSTRLTSADHADWLLSGGIWTIEMWVKQTAAALSTIYSQATDANNWFQIEITAARGVQVLIRTSGTTTTILQSATGVIPRTSSWVHLAFVENGDDWYIFVGGKLVASTTSTTRAANYSGAIFIGALYNGSTYAEYFAGKMDEIRISNTVARYTAPFHPSNIAFGSAGSGTPTSVATFRVGVTRPVYGFKFYISGSIFVGTITSPTVNYWDGNQWVGATVTANTTTNFSTTGHIQFADTQSTAKPTMWDGLYLYWYTFTGVATGIPCTYLVTAQENMQPMKDIWDGLERPIMGFLTYDYAKKKYSDFTIQVLEDSYASADTGTYVKLGGLTSFESASAEHFVVAFLNKTSAVHFYVPEDKGNETAKTVVAVKFWNGSAWEGVQGLVDGTSEETKSFAKTGWVSWTPPTPTSTGTGTAPAGIEQRKEINNDVPLYYYQFSFNKSLSADAIVYYCTGAPAPIQWKPYLFPLFAMNRVFLCNSVSDYRNSAKCCAADAADVWNGDDALDLYFGDASDLVAAAWIYSQFGSNVYNVVAFMKRAETWILVGNDPSKWEKYRVSSNIGCIAPKTVAVINAPYELSPQSNRTIAIWQAADGIYIFDGRGFTPIHGDIKGIFDGTGSTVLNRSQVDICEGFYDPRTEAYHWRFPSGTATTLTNEMVYDVKRRKWYEIQRGTYALVQSGTIVSDTSGNSYAYGFNTAGLMYRLENGTTFPASSSTTTTIQCTFALGDMLLGGSTWSETQPRVVMLTMKEGGAADSVVMSHFADTVSSASDTETKTTNHATKRVVRKSWSDKFKEGVFHKFKFVHDSFYPKAVAILFHEQRMDERGD